MKHVWMTATVAENTDSNKAKGKEETEMVKKKKKRHGWINRYMTNCFSLLLRGKVSSDVQSQLVCKFYQNNFKLLIKGYLHYSLAGKYSMKNFYTPLL